MGKKLGLRPPPLWVLCCFALIGAMAFLVTGWAMEDSWFTYVMATVMIWYASGWAGHWMGKRVDRQREERELEELRRLYMEDER